MSPGSTSIRSPPSILPAACLAESAIFDSTSAAIRSSGSSASSRLASRVPMKPGNPVRKTRAAMGRGRLPEDGAAHVVGHHDGKEHAVEAVEHAAVRAEEAAGVLHVEVAL